jgi:hypothetical protein
MIMVNIIIIKDTHLTPYFGLDWDRVKARLGFLEFWIHSLALLTSENIRSNLLCHVLPIES